MEIYKMGYNLLVPYLNEMKKYVIDVGAFNFTTSNTKEFADNGFNVMLIEPNPDSYKILCEQTKDYKKVIILPIAMYNYVGKTKFLNSEQNKAYSRIPNNIFRNGKHVPTTEIEVDCWTFKHLFEKYPEYKNVDFIDIDVEGMDEVVLEDLFENQVKPKFIMIEHQHKETRKYQQNNIFTENNYIEFKDIGISKLWKNLK